MKHTRTVFPSLILTLLLGAQAHGQQVFNYLTMAGMVGSPGNTNATGVSASFNVPLGVAVDSHGNVFVTDTLNNLIREITSEGVVSTYAGSGANGHHDANGTAATFGQPAGLAVDSSGNIYVADTFNDTIRKIDTSGNVTTFAGIALSPGSANSNTVATAATFSSPAAVAVDSSGNVYVADTGNNLIRKIAAGATVGGAVTTIANPTPAFNGPKGIAVSSSTGTVYVTDTGNDAIREITSGGTVSVFAGGSAGSSDGTGTGAQFLVPTGIAIDSNGNLYVSDTGNDTIRKITTAAVVTTIGGTAGTSSPFANGTDSYAIFKAPEGVAIDSVGTLFVADSEDDVIREGITLSINGDLTGTGMPDVFWTDTSGGDRGAYIMNHTTIESWADLGTIPTDWRIAAVADFTGNGHNDILWQNSSTGECGFWMMDGTTVTGWVELGNISTDWRIAAVGNFHGTGSSDILWQNTITGECGFYIMDGTAVTGWAELGIIPTEWKIAAAADFNGDGKPDILWQNTSTGECGFYIMNGTAVTSWAEVGFIPLEWRVGAVGDFNGDGMPDILWEDSNTGECGFYIMNNTTVTGWVTLVTVPLEWQIQP